VAHLDVVVIGSGPNGLAAAIHLLQAGLRVRVVEAASEPGGGTRTAELTLPGFRHDVCSAAHPLGVLSPFFRSLRLEDHGLRWVTPAAAVAHPLDDRPAVILWPSVQKTASELGSDGPAYRRMVEPFLRHIDELLNDALAPLRWPRHPFILGRFGLSAWRSAVGLARDTFNRTEARALFIGCAAHGIQPLENPLTAALGIIFLVTGHAAPWPVAEGGSSAIPRALVSLLRRLGGELVLNQPVRSLSQLPPARAYVFDTSPRAVVEICGQALPGAYRRRLERFRYGPGVFKLDWALSGPIPWRDSRISAASTVHLGGDLNRIAAAERTMYDGRHPDRPFILLCQQSLFDPTRAPTGRHTAYAYAHVPAHSDLDLTHTLEAEVERQAPGFRDLVLARHAITAVDFERYNPNYVGGAISGGVTDALQLFTRPVARLDPYTTPNPKIFMCSAATPPGAGVHGMCGFWAARSVLRRLSGSG
jgi:phytoene dehydrogenase-like protein